MSEPAEKQVPTLSEKKKKRQKKNKILYTLFLIGFCIALGLLLYSPFADLLSRYMQTITIGQYVGDVSGLSESDIARLKAEAIEYNAKIYEEQLKKPFAYEGEEYDDPEYDKILKVSKYSSVMANIEIPSLNVYIPILHGTHMDELNMNAGHMHGTSVPIGGPNTHAVIAAHTGLRSADLFSGLTKLKKGDVFYIHVLDEIHVYTIDQIVVVLPNEANQYMGIIQGHDYTTLYTCTPYGINSHRLLVRGERTYPDLTKKGTAGENADLLSRRILLLILTILIGLIPFIVLALGLYYIWRNQEKVKQRKEKRKQKKFQSQQKKTDILTNKEEMSENSEQIETDSSSSDTESASSEEISNDDTVSTAETVDSEEQVSQEGIEDNDKESQDISNFDT